MEKQIVILGKIGNTEFQNNDTGKVLSRRGVTKCIRGGSGDIPPSVIKQYQRK